MFGRRVPLCGRRSRLVVGEALVDLLALHGAGGRSISWGSPLVDEVRRFTKFISSNSQDPPVFYATCLSPYEGLILANNQKL